MADNLDFLSPTDKPALLALSTPEWMAKAQASLSELGYKVHLAANHDDFMARFFRASYQVIVIEEKFAASTPAENIALLNLQRMLMSQRRHVVIILLGESFQSLNSMQAFQQSVHAVVHPGELANLKDIINKAVVDNDLFLKVYRDTLNDVATRG